MDDEDRDKYVIMPGKIFSSLLFMTDTRLLSLCKIAMRNVLFPFIGKW